MMDIQAARNYFPRGLAQPEGSFRFSIDALLLAAFAAQVPVLPAWPVAGPPPLLLDLGCGCGVAAFAVLLQRPEYAACGLDKQVALLAAAKSNAAKLGFENCYRTIEADLEAPDGQQQLERLFARRKAALVMANPPYRLPGRGRLPASISRQQALFGGPGNLAAFIRAAALALDDVGTFCLIFPFARAQELVEGLLEQGFAPTRQLLVRNRAAEEPFFILLAAQKKVNPGAAALCSELILYESGISREGADNRAGLTEEALSFCSFLACNRKRG